MKASSFQSPGKAGKEPGSSLRVQARCCECRPILPHRPSRNPSGSPTSPGGNFLGGSLCCQDELLVCTNTRANTHRSVVLNKVRLEKGDLCQQTDEFTCGGMWQYAVRSELAHFLCPAMYT